MKRNQPETTYAQMGMAALLPGMTHMLDLMQRHIDEFRAQLNGLQNGARRVGRPRGGAGNSGWPDDPEERSVEMKRRQAVARDKLLRGTRTMTPEGRAAISAAQKSRWAKTKAATHPRDPQHPQHDAWLAKLKRQRKAAWAKLSPAEQKAKLARMNAGKQIGAKMAVAS